MNALVLSGTNNLFTCECDDGETRLCTIKGKVIKTEKEYYNPLAPGDSVEIEIDPINNEKGQIINLLPRKNTFARWNIKGKAPQLLASNLDYLILVTTPDEPPFRPRFIDRELIQADVAGITPIIVVNKYDLEASGDPDFQERITTWEELGYQVMRISAKTGEGLVELAELLKDKTSALVGQSGVGKSSLVNVLDNTCVLKTGSLSKKYGKGQHTTTKGTLMHIQLNESLTGGVQGITASIIDTPGIRRFILHEIDYKDVGLYFREMQPLIGKCKFGASCSHLNEPGCKILEAVYSGVISEDRYESWKRITNEIKTGDFDE
ncbi:MAG: ribosome small subunit-dependent GTPase A [Treponema sp.]|nr:ribosome small subunit-dependent GTPase A [Candidatus Treponema merdequi]